MIGILLAAAIAIPPSCHSTIDSHGNLNISSCDNSSDETLLHQRFREAWEIQTKGHYCTYGAGVLEYCDLNKMNDVESRKRVCFATGLTGEHQAFYFRYNYMDGKLMSAPLKLGPGCKEG